MKENPSPVNQDLSFLLSRKIEALEDYYTATVLLGRTLAEKDPVRIGSVLNLRDNCIQNITLIDREIQKSFAGSFAYGSKNNIANDLLVKLEEVIRRTKVKDNNCLDDAVALLKETGDGLMFIDRGLNSFQGYDEKQCRKPRFLDIKT